MRQAFQVVYHPDVQRKDLSRISYPDRLKIRKAIEAKLFTNPEKFGEPLRRTLKGYWKLRVGDYRVIFKVVGSTVHVLRIGHRSEIYKRLS